MSHPYFGHYPEQVQQQVDSLLQQQRLGQFFTQRYPHPHDIKTDKQLYNYIERLRQEYMKNSPRVHLAAYVKRHNMALNALGTHTYKTTQHGGRHKTSHQIHIEATLRHAPEPILRALVVHELAHFKEKQHNKAFYNLCQHMEPHYHQLELELRLFLLLCEAEGNIYLPD